MGMTVCIGDIHGFHDKLQRLWSNLHRFIGSPAFERATVIFLGDYCDRGPNTSKVVDFLVSLPSRYPSQKHVFLCGNHDFAFAAFLNILPPPHASSFSDTWKAFEGNEEREGWWAGEGSEEMHIQGRRWAGNIRDRFNVKKGVEYQGSIYDARPTFESYGVPHGHIDLMKVVPEEHKKFLQDLVWVHEEGEVDTGDPEIGCTKLVAVHAGLEKTHNVEEQLKVLYNKDVTLPRVEALSGRKNVWDIPLELSEKKVLLVSGHHGTLHVDKFRFIIDECGGLEHLPIAAIVFPSGAIIRDTDSQA